MKKIIFTVLAVLCFGTVKSQEVSLIAKKPMNANGYLIMNRSFYSDIRQWEIVIKERVLDPVTGEYNFQDRLSRTLLGLDYLKVPESFRGSNFFVDVKGIKQDGTIVTSNDIIIGPPTETICTWVCNGSHYAYGLEMNDVPFSGARIKMTNTPTPNDAPHYYEWIQASNWSTFITNQNPSWYGFGNTWPSLGSNAAGDKIIQINVPYGQYKYDRFGTPMNGNLIGIAKGFGPYTGQVVNIMSDPLTVMENDCSQPISWAINLVNQGSDHNVNVSCDGRFTNTHFVFADGIIADVFDPFSGDPCFESAYDYLGWQVGTGLGVYQLIQLPCNMIVTNPNTGTSGVSWPENVTQMTIKKQSGASSDDIVLRYDNIFDEEGNFIGENHFIESGFYNVVYQFSDLSIGSYYFEVTESTNSTILDKDYLSYNVFPVPVTGNSFSLDLQSPKRLSFIYELRDFRGNLIFSSNFELDKDFEVTKLIQVNQGIPDGMLFNKMKFADGSEINFTTIK